MSLPTLVGIPLEIRFKIVTLLLNHPALPNFESIPPTTTIANYVALGLVNKQLNSEMKTILLTSRNLAIISSNWDDLSSTLSSHAIPIISTKSLSKLKSHVMRIHVTFPLDCGHRPPSVVKSAMVVLTSSLRNIALLLRSLSLEIPHAPGIPVASFGYEFPRMKLSVRFEACANSFSSTELNKAFQKSLVKQLAPANRVGIIKIMGAADDSIAKLLPGHTEKFTPEPGLNLVMESFRRTTEFHNNRMKDGEDYIKLASWKLTIAKKAFDAQNWDLAELRFGLCISFVGDAGEKNMYVLNGFSDLEPKLDIVMFRAGMGLVKTLIKKEDWDCAKHHIKPVLDSLDERPWLDKRELRIAKGLAKKIKDHFKSKK